MELSLRGVPVKFPFKPYNIQKAYMEKVIESLQKSENALLESPTGTGKTLALLCAALAWRQSLVHRVQEDTLDFDDNPNAMGNVPKIVYCSRTHTQLAQVVKELKSTSYNPPTCILGSRKQMCIHPKISKLPNRDSRCRYFVANDKCSYYSGVSSVAATLQPEIMAIEDLVQLGKSHNACPYYLTRQRQKDATILLAPYNYLVDPKIRKSLNIDLHGSVIFFDEAHNLEAICEDAASLEIGVSSLKACLREVEDCIGLVGKAEYTGECRAHDLSKLKEVLVAMVATIDNLRLPRQGGLNLPGDYLIDLLDGAGVNQTNYTHFVDWIDHISDDLAALPDLRKTAKITALKDLSQVLSIVFEPEDKREIFQRNFRSNVHESFPERAFSRTKERVLSVWCFNAGLAVKGLLDLGVRNMIFTSGTLSPLSSFAALFSMSFPIRLENPHVVSERQLWVGVLKKGPNNVSLNSAYRNRNSPKYLADLGNTVLHVARVTPDGLLVFFPSYGVMKNCLDAWKKSGHGSDGSLWEQISRVKKPVVEPKESFQFSHAISDFYARIRDPHVNGAVFFAVCRGKVSEGLDFANANGRAVIITGLPFPSLVDPRVKEKRRFLDAAASMGGMLNGGQWYGQQASSAVNQAIGRIIRNRTDWGAIILCDERFSYTKQQQNLSAWLQPKIRTFSGDFGKALLALKRFFNNLKLNAPVATDSSEEPLLTTDPFHASKSSLLPSAPSGNSGLEPLALKETDASGRTQSKKPKRKHSPKQHAEAVKFIKQAKKHLSRTEYKHFQQSLSLFRQNKIKVEQLVTRMEQLFSTQERFGLKKSFVQFLPHKYHQEYRSRLSQRPLLQGVEPGMSRSSHLEGVRVTRQSRQATTKPKRKAESPVDILTGKKPRKQLHKRTATLPNRLSLAGSNNSSTSEEPNEETPSSQGGDENTQNDTAEKCPICRGSIIKPFAAKCKHVCCFDCWSRWLKERLECPVCRTRTRKKSLREIFFSPSG